MNLSVSIGLFVTSFCFPIVPKSVPYFFFFRIADLHVRRLFWTRTLTEQVIQRRNVRGRFATDGLERWWFHPASRGQQLPGQPRLERRIGQLGQDPIPIRGGYQADAGQSSTAQLKFVLYLYPPLDVVTKFSRKLTKFLM